MRASKDLLAKVKEEAARCGSHSEQEWLGVELLGEAAGEQAALLRCQKGEVLAWLPAEAAAAGLTDDRKVESEEQECKRLIDLAMSGDLDPAGQERLAVLLGVKKPVKGPHVISEEEAAYLRRHGHDPRLIERMDEVNSPADFARLKAAMEARGGVR